jgi:DNA mismatch repair protein MutS
MGGVLPLPGELDTARAALDALPAALEDAIAAAIVDDPPLQRRDGGFVRAGYDADLDAARALRDESRAVIAGLQQDYAAATGVKALKVRHNNFLGFFVEVPAAAAGPMLAAPLNARFIHRQTMQDAMRFSTPELAELEGRIASAGETATAAEIAAFDRILADLATAAPALRAAADALARIDVAAALAEVAARRGWTRPALSEGLAFRIAGGRHPVVEAALEAAGKPFVANDLDLSGADGSGAGRAGAEAGRILLVTGPNMGGKSTFLRQNALIAILAQIGSYVPAASAEIGLVDRVFSRVGASDDLASGRSTFMVEMVETAAILNQATARSLVILDEIGRGTATFDGLSIAWATIEHLHESVRARTLFATHYHELTALAGALPRLSNATLRATEHDGRIVFLHEVIEGAADRSYGIQVARLAGLPAAVTERARAILETLERAERTPGAARILDDLPLFAARAPAAAPAAPPDPMASLRAAIEAMRPDEMSPRAALDALYALRALLPGRAGGPRDRG